VQKGAKNNFVMALPSRSDFRLPDNAYLGKPGSAVKLNLTGKEANEQT
jgi:hypothetical protein